MANYFHSNTNSNIAPSWPNTTAYDKEAIGASPASGQVSFTLDEADVGPDQIQTGSAITIVDKPNSDAWENGGTVSLDLDCSVGNMDTRARIRAVMLSSTGIIRQQGSFGSYVTTDAGQKTLTCTAPTWTETEVCGDRFAIEVEHENLNTHGNKSITLDLGEFGGAGNNDIITTVTEDQGSCGPDSALQDIIGGVGIIPFAR